jgi:hypothetical protein
MHYSGTFVLYNKKFVMFYFMIITLLPVTYEKERKDMIVWCNLGKFKSNRIVCGNILTKRVTLHVLITYYAY